MNLAIDIMDGCGISNEMCSQLLGLGDSGIFSIRGNAGYTIHDYEYYHDTSREVRRPRKLMKTDHNGVTYLYDFYSTYDTFHFTVIF